MGKRDRPDSRENWAPHAFSNSIFNPCQPTTGAITMQAIITTYKGPTNTRGARILARCEAGSITISWDHAQSSEGNHRAAAEALKQKLSDRCGKRYGTKPWDDVWVQPTVCGMLPTGPYCHVFLPKA